MNAQQLKNSILQMAVQGRLVPQDANDEPASVLLERIRAEKEEMIKEGKIKKDRNSSCIFRGENNQFYEKVGNNEPVCITDIVPFEIPDSWEWVRLGSISSYSDTKLKVKAQEAAPSLWELDLEDIQKGGSILVKHTVGERKAIGDKTYFEAGDVLFSKLRPYLLKILVADENGICTPEIVPFKVYGSISPDYVVAFLKSPYANETINAATYGIKMPRAGTETMTGLLVPIPPINEQHRIIELLNNLESSISRYNVKHLQLSKLNSEFSKLIKSSILQQAIMGKLVPQDPNDEQASELYKRRGLDNRLTTCKYELIMESMRFEIPESWKWVEVSQLFDFVDYRGKTPHKINSGVCLITASNIKQGYMDYTRQEFISSEEYETRKSRGITEKGDLLFTTEAPMGNAALCDQIECSCGQRVITLKECFKETICPKLYMYFILSPAFQKQILDNCTGTTAKGIKGDKFKHLIVPFPPLREQYRIVDKIDELFIHCDLLTN